MTETDKTGTEQLGRALHDFLNEFYQGSRRSWMHDFFGTEFNQGQDHALTGLVLIPELRSALDSIDTELGSQLEHWHGKFEAMRESKLKESQ